MNDIVSQPAQELLKPDSKKDLLLLIDSLKAPQKGAGTHTLHQSRLDPTPDINMDDQNTPKME